MSRAKKLDPIDEALVETAEDLLTGGLIRRSTADKITMRVLGRKALTYGPVSAEEIRVLRERERMSQAVFALYLNVTVGYLSQLERGVKHASGPALALLNVIRRKGIEAIF